MSNISTILAHLNTPKYDAVRDQIRAAFLARVESDFREWAEKVLNFVVPEPCPGYIREFPQVGEARLYLNKPARVEQLNNHRRYRAIQEAVRFHEYQIDKQKVQDAADLEWENTKLFYAGRVGEKIDLLLEGDAEVSCSISGSRLLVGTIVATLGKKRLVLDTSLKTNYRYGVFAADRKMTVYWQVPTVVESYSGFDLPAREAQIERETAAAKEDRKSAMGALQKEIGDLEKQKRVWDDIYSTFRFSADYEKNGEPMQPRYVAQINASLDKLKLPELAAGHLNMAMAFAEVKKLRASIKAAKLKLREVRKPKVEAVV